MSKIAIGGWQHETNTFAFKKANYDDFVQADEWPPLAEGHDLLAAIDGVHLPVTGAIDVLKDRQHELIPLLWCSATPCSYVTQHAFETISSRFLQLLENALPVDGVYLDLHGAMVCEHLEDGEGEFLSLIRSLVGPDIPIAVSLDLHANITPLMVEHATVIDVFRTYPHVDMGETGSRAAQHLDAILSSNNRWFKAFRQVPFLIPLNWGCTLIEPAMSLYAQMPNELDEQVKAISFACGFHLSDIHNVGPSVLAYAETQDEADNAADRFLAKVIAQEAQFSGRIWPDREGVTEALALLQDESCQTIVLADTQDNPGGGGAGDTTGLLSALLDGGVTNALFGVVNDPIAAELAANQGIGNDVEIELGERSGLSGHLPMKITAKVVNITDGQFTATGPMYKGARMQLGLCALVEIDGVQVMISSKAVQAADQAIFRHMGIDLNDKSIIALKSSVHFRNDFTNLADVILVVSSPGEVYADPNQLKYKNIRPALR